MFECNQISEVATPRNTASSPHEVADLHLDDVAGSQLAVDRKIEHGSVSELPVLIEAEPNGPDLLRLQRSFCAEFSAGVPWPPLGTRIKL